jgi:RNA polymerase sigma-70 factor, ECF subfamily
MLSLTEARAAPLPKSQPAFVEPIDALAALDAGAWQQLFERYHGKMYSFVYARTGDTSAAEEIAAEVFVAAAKGISRYRPTGAPFAAWLYRIARNLTADYLERRRKRPAISLEGLDFSAGPWHHQVEDAADIASALQKLKAEQQEVIILRFFADYSLQEVATAMGKSVGAVKLLQHRAIVAMRKHMTPGDAR